MLPDVAKAGFVENLGGPVLHGVRLPLIWCGVRGGARSPLMFKIFLDQVLMASVDGNFAIVHHPAPPTMPI